MYATAAIQEKGHEALNLAGVGEAPTAQEANQGSLIKRGLAIAGIAVVGLIGAKAAEAEASVAEGSGHSNSTSVNAQTGITVRAAHSWQKDTSGAYVNVMGNHRVVSKQEVEEAKQEGDCFWVNGK